MRIHDERVERYPHELRPERSPVMAEMVAWPSATRCRSSSRRVFRKLGVSTQDEAVARGRRLGLP